MTQRISLAPCRENGICQHPHHCVCDVDPTDPRDTTAWREEVAKAVAKPRGDAAE